MTILIILILFGIGSAIVASNKNRSVAGWFVLGMLLGPFGLLFILLLQPLYNSEPTKISSWGWSFTAIFILIIAICFYYASGPKEKISSSRSSPSLTKDKETVKERGGAPIGRAYGAAGITKTLRKLGYPTKWTILGDTYGGSPVLLLECSKFSEASINSFIEGGILSDLYTDCFDRVDFLNGSRTWSYELNQTHLRPRPKGKSYLFYSNLSEAEADQVDKQFDKAHGF